MFLGFLGVTVCSTSLQGFLERERESEEVCSMNENILMNLAMIKSTRQMTEYIGK